MEPGELFVSESTRLFTTYLIALLWGFAAGAFFFIVPDVFLTAVAARDERVARVASLWSTFGALLGGVLLYTWGAFDSARALGAMERVPAISAELTASVGRQLQSGGCLAIVQGGFTGVPYKLYAVHAGAMGLSLPLFLFVSSFARAGRFLLTTTMASSLFRLCFRNRSTHCKLTAIALLWILFYSWYFSVHPN